MRSALFCLIVSFSVLTSCGKLPVEKRFKEDFTNCYDTNTLALNSKLRFDGYYQFQSIHRNDTNDFNFIFYPDGTFVNNVIFPDFYPLWGIYKTKGDTVITQYLSVTYGAPRLAGESWYKIVSTNNLKLIYHAKLGKELTSAHMFYSSQAVNEDTASRFIPSVNLPGPASWLKNEEWTYCSKRAALGYPFSLRENLENGEYEGRNGSFRGYLTIKGDKAYANIAYFHKNPKFKISDTFNLRSFQSTSILGKKMVLFKRKNKLYLGNRDNNEESAFVIPLKPKKKYDQLSDTQMQEINMREGEYVEKSNFLLPSILLYNVSIHADTAIVDVFSKPRYRSKKILSDTLIKTAARPALFLSDLYIIYYKRGSYILKTRKDVMPSNWLILTQKNENR